MQKPPQQGPKEGFGTQDILYILFKHKWKIVILSLLGFGAAAGVFVNRKPFYQSEAKILVEYIISAATADPQQPAGNTTGGPGDTAINTEIEILKSQDVAKETAKAVGLDKLLPEAKGQATDADGAAKIQGFLEVSVIPLNNVLHVSWGCENPKLSTEALGELIKQYKAKSLEIHRSVAAFEEVAKETKEVWKQLKQTEAELAKLRMSATVASLADVYKERETRQARAQEGLTGAQEQLAEQTAKLKAMEKVLQQSGISAPVPEDLPQAVAAPLPAQILGEYRSLLDVLVILQKRDVELRLKFKPGNRLLATNEQQLADYDAKRRALIDKYPALVTEATVVDGDSKNPKVNLETERATLAAITGRVKFYEGEIEEIKKLFSEQYSIGEKIDELERRRQMEDERYRTMALNLEKAEFYKKLDPSRMPNIKTIQEPSTPIKTYDKITQKIVLGLAGGGMAIGIGLAFMIELLFDRRVKRPTEIQARLQLPLLLSIPYIRRKERGELLLAPEPDVPRIGKGADSTLPAIANFEDPERAIRKANHFILPYSETIRDRIIFNFEVNNVVHKPKLVAVTGLSAGAGSSTIAAGLAKSFSEITGAKVLLVDLSSHQPDGNPAFGDVTRHSLSGALQLARNTTFKKNAQNLYYASATARRDDSGLTTFSPMHLYELMPHLQASEFDYIVFDMPAIDQTSRTLTMAGLMDKVLLVLDAENTSRDALKWGYSELVKGRADVSCIFNKTRSHAPNWLIGKS